MVPNGRDDAVVTMVLRWAANCWANATESMDDREFDHPDPVVANQATSRAVLPFFFVHGARVHRGIYLKRVTESGDDSWSAVVAAPLRTLPMGDALAEEYPDVVDAIPDATAAQWVAECQR